MVHYKVGFSRKAFIVLNHFLTVLICIVCLLPVIYVLALSLMQPGAELIDVAYECASAMGTVGISSLGTPTLNMPSKILILMTMYFGRVGPLSLAVLLASRQWKKKEHFRYPEDRVMIG